MSDNSWITNLPKVGIRPTIDGRYGGVRESLEDQVMNMAKSAAVLISASLKYPNGEPVECVIADTCIGCGSCHTICQNHAIDMVPVEEFEGRPGDSGLRPRFDYGRCCWCGLCVDICTAASLRMSNEYAWISEDPTVFHFTAGVDDKPWQDNENGYRRAEGYPLYPPKRIEMEMLPPEESIKSFDEVARGYDEQQAKLEADRCVECGICVATCPAHMDIPLMLRQVAAGELRRDRGRIAGGVDRR